MYMYYIFYKHGNRYRNNNYVIKSLKMNCTRIIVILIACNKYN